MSFLTTIFLSNKTNKYHQAEDLYTPILQLKRRIQKGLQMLRKLMKRNQEDDLQTQNNRNDFQPLFDFKEISQATFDDFLIDQCTKFKDGTQQNIMVGQHLQHLKHQYKIFLRLLICLLQELQNIFINSPDFHQKDIDKTLNNLIFKIVKTIENLIASDDSGDFTTNQSVQNFSQCISLLNIYFENNKNNGKCNNQFFNYNFQVKAKIIVKQLAKFTKYLKYVFELKKAISQYPSAESKLKKMRSFEMNQMKIILSELINSFIEKQNSKTQICLNCQKQIRLNQMIAHVKTCKILYSYYEEIDKIDTQLNGRLQDLQSLSISVKKIKNQKQRKQLQLEKTNKPKPFTNKFSKSLYDKRNKSQYIYELTKKKSEEEESSEEQSEGSTVSLSGLSLNDLTKYLEIIEDLKRFILRMKDYKKKSINSCIYSEIKELKSELRDNYDHLKSADILEIVNLITNKFKILNNIEQIEIKTKGKEKLKSDSKPMRFQREYQHLDSCKSQSLLQEQDCQTGAYSDDESIVSSTSINDYNVSLKDFKILRQLAQGKYGKVFLVKKIATGVKYAMKRIQLSNHTDHNQFEKLVNQNDAFSIVNNDFLVKAIFSFSSKKYHYFVMEYASNGDFADKLQQQERMFERQAKPLLAEIAVAIQSLHELGIIHRDIKPQNIVIDSEGHLKLTDYGLSETKELKKKKLQDKAKQSSRFVKDNIINKKADESPSRVQKIVGSPYYMAPQVVSFQPITRLSDWWSFGIIVYQTLVGTPPFMGKNFSQIAQKIEKCNIWWTNEIIFGNSDNMISYQAKDLIQRLLTPNPEKRLGQHFQDIMSHKFFMGLNWKNLRNVPSTISVYEEQQYDQIDAKVCFEDSETSSYVSTCSNLKLIRRDVLTKETKISYYKHLGNMIYLRKIAERLRDEANHC